MQFEEVRVENPPAEFEEAAIRAANRLHTGWIHTPLGSHLSLFMLSALYDTTGKTRATSTPTLFHRAITISYKAFVRDRDRPM
jgi:hypothetical protein